jgi:two-component system, cell cycle sensor histidine kinase and response regulator CckA
MSETDAHLQAVMQAVPDAIIGMRPDGTITLFTGAAERMFRITAEGAVGRSIGSLIREGAWKEEVAALSSPPTGGGRHGAAAIAVTGVRGDGSDFAAEALFSAFELPGTGVEVLAVLRESATGGPVAAQRATTAEAEQALRAAQARLAGVLNSATDAIITVDEQHRIQLFNRGAEQIFRVSAADMIGENLQRLLPMRFQGRHERHMREFATSGVNERAMSAREITGVRADGEEFPAEARISQVTVGEQRLLTVILRDITERKLAQEELRSAKAFADRLLASVTNGIATFDLELCIRSVNRQWLEIAGWQSEEDVVGRPLESLFDQENAGLVRAAFEEVRRAGEALRGVECQVSRPDRSRRWILLGIAPLLDDAARVSGFVAAADDFTERRHAEQTLLQAQKLESLGVLAGGIAHDFNNLLVGILGNAGLALAELPPGSPLREILREMEVAGQRAAELVHQMLAYSGKGRFVIEQVDMNDLIQEMTHLMRASIARTTVVEYDLAARLPAVQVDPTQIRQLVMNLVVNASDAIGARGGRIAVSTGVIVADEEYLREAYLSENCRPGNYVYVEVADDGEGMDAETKARIFDPFFTTKFTGRGLGLAAALGIVRGHRGAILVASKVGEGTTFRVLLPAERGHVHATPAPRVEDQPRGRGTVLVVDDEETVRRVTRRALERMGFEVLTAADGEAGVAAFRARAAEVVCVLLDLTMPGTAGEETLAAMRGIRAEVPVLVMSGYNEQAAMDRLGANQTSGFIQKPYDISALGEAVLRAISARP